MIYARYLAVGGFKSFRDWNLLEFSPGVSVIVGGNGSGKTSLVEALLWALGEEDPGMLRIQGRRDLLHRTAADGGLSPVRSEREQHLLFIDPKAPGANGSDGGEAEAPPDVEEAAVYLVLGDDSQLCGCADDEEDEADGCCCAPAQEQEREVPEGLVTVTRRLQADGGEEWQVDGGPADADAVDAALAPHGLNRAVVSVVRQGEVERMLLADPALRAWIVAETAGLEVPARAPRMNGSARTRRIRRSVGERLRQWGVTANDGVDEERVLRALGIAPEDGAHDGDLRGLDEVVERVAGRANGHFSALVPGGRVRLELSRSAGVPELEVFVTFPGSDEEEVDTLSGGQRALVAFSLGVAVFQETPSRLLILDEVEPALDERNLRRFNDVLHEIAEDRQVVVVSHQRRTKDVGDVVFGVDVTGNGASMLHFRYVPSTQQLILFGRVRGNWLERTAAHENEQALVGPRSASLPEPSRGGGGGSCC